VKHVRVEPEVYDDLAAAADWYETRQAGLGARFLDAMRGLMKAVEERPGAYASESGKVHVAFTRPFPYKLYYLHEKDSIRIFAVIHSARHPDTWRARRPSEDE
jgi:plasmid stabilization system protein ParE